MDQIKEKITYHNTKLYIAFMAVITVVLFLTNYDGEIDSYNTTILALNYTVGFTSRGFIGTVFYLIDMILPFSIMNVTGARVFLFISTLLLVVVLFLFMGMILKRCSDRYLVNVELFMMFLLVAVVSTFSAEWNYGRVDMYMIIISLVCIMLIIKGKGEWLIIPLTIIGVLIHQGYVFMYYNIVILALMLVILTHRNKRVKYILILLISLVVCSVLFLYLELFSHAANGQEIYQSVASTAMNLSSDGKYHKTLLAHELLGVDLSGVEHDFHMKNLVEITLLGILLIPYIIIFVKLLVRLIKSCNNRLDVCKYIIVYIGSLTMLPDYIVKIDFGRWVLSTLVYYLVVFLYLYISDSNFQEVTSSYILDIKKKYKVYPLVIVYPLLLVPFHDVNINSILAIWSHWINVGVLHWWPV